MKRWTLFLLATVGVALSAAGNASASHIQNLEDRGVSLPIATVRQSLCELAHPGTGHVCRSPKPAFDETRLFTRDRFAFDRKVICNFFTPEALCGFATRACGHKYKSVTTGANTGIKRMLHDRGCAVTSFEGQLPRFQDRLLVSQIVGYAAGRFEELLRDRELQWTCCQNDEACASHFQKTGFNVIMGAELQDLETHYRFCGRNAHTIEVTMGRLVSARNEESIDRLLLHELGHACQYSRHVRSSRERTKLDRDEGCVSADLSIADIDATMGNEFTSCLFPKLLGEAARLEGRVCFGSWASEAFADAVFAFKRTELAHWAWDCVGVTDSWHPPSEAVMGCLTKTTRLRDAWCK